MLRIKLVKSPTGHTPANRATIKALGLRKVHQVVEKQDSPAIRGMVRRVQHLVLVESLNGNLKETGSEGAARKSENAETKTPVEAATKAAKPKSAKPKAEVPKTKAAKSKEGK